MGKICVFANQKGGVGKTTSAVNIGAYLAEAGKKVLLIDFDSQANLSSSVGADREQPGIYEVITRKTPASATVQPTPIPNLSIIPSNIDLSGAAIELADVAGREFYLKNAISGIKENYDYIFVDCPPSLGILTVNGLAAAEFVLIPLQCEYFALEGLNSLLQTIGSIQRGINPALKIGGILFTMYDTRTRIAHEVVQEVTEYFKEKVFRTVIPRNVRLSEAPSHGIPINRYDPDCIGALSYRKLTEEVMRNV
ncbi:MAG TPA: ParA family protein [Spirochaetia bacterium]|nr:ParA family protein [Spirochaetia bacterium]